MVSKNLPSIERCKSARVGERGEVGGLIILAMQFGIAYSLKLALNHGCIRNRNKREDNGS